MLLNDIMPFKSAALPWTQPDDVMIGADCACAPPMVRTIVAAIPASVTALRCTVATTSCEAPLRPIPTCASRIIKAVPDLQVFPRFWLIFPTP